MRKTPILSTFLHHRRMHITTAADQRSSACIFRAYRSTDHSWAGDDVNIDPLPVAAAALHQRAPGGLSHQPGVSQWRQRQAALQRDSLSSAENYDGNDGAAPAGYDVYSGYFGHQREWPRSRGARQRHHAAVDHRRGITWVVFFLIVCFFA